MPEATEPTNSAEPKQNKKRDKVRSAWISFVGRIAAQVIRPLPAVPLAKWYALTDNKEAAYQMLERARAHGLSLQQLKSDPVFDAMRGEARYAAVVQRGTGTK